ncbi:CRISPR system Cascade subunit CasB [Nocardia sp. GAS34]|uniref:type I-E CRISPR-associated protein Cse2/CasB n=1 Tax=unclassified Nocardia TaxID=2637762 RepID=UPI003D24EF57
MSTASTQDTALPNGSSQDKKLTTITSKDAALQQFVGDRVGALQARYIKDDSDAVAARARLRRGVGVAAGSRPDIWEETLRGLPEVLADTAVMSRAERDGTATAWEQAAHDAITLHAWHQQSRDKPMHRHGASFGGAVRALSERGGSQEAVRRRFHMVATASQYTVRLAHLRALISQLRTHAIPLDYARVARDLRWLQDRRYSERVLLEWGRDYHRAPPKDTTAQNEPVTATEEGELQ